jgi:IS30 family transposase
VSIEKRPAAADLRDRIGDLEGDLIVGYRSSGHVLTVVDRKSRFVVLRKLKCKKKVQVRKQLQAALKQLGEVRTLTVDNGTEFTDHSELTRLTNIPVYFCHPYCSTERGTVENTNGLIRQYLPKGTSFENLSQAELNRIQNQLNNRPRECLGFLTPHEIHFKKDRIPPHGRPLHL